MEASPPVNRETELVAREPLDGPYVLLTFRHREVARAGRAGQFVMIKAGTSAEPPLRRPFSILTVDPAAETFRLFLKVIGAGTRALAALAPGEVAQCLGPLGRAFAPPPAGHAALLVAGGYGIAPFHLFCEEMGRAKREARVFYGGRTAADLQVRAPFARMGVPLVAATDDGSEGHHGRVTQALEAHLEAHPGPATLYACGPDPMLHAVARLAARRGLPAQVSLDPWMGCGVGTCLGCVVWTQTASDARPRYRCACTEGPVFDAGAVVWAGDEMSASRRTALSAVAGVPSPEVR
ncbi:MAG TPA: dihydroorotate dehydrogenase electron transfer subunit [Vicinamibacteria bacterium]|nr:dihydroorotate dehydrogenase electron transfer subunit [Vicinamibacteria bacterium]